MTATTIPADGRCVTCRDRVRTKDSAPVPGVRVYQCRGECTRCNCRGRRLRKQPAGTPRAGTVKRSVLVAEVLHLRGFGESEQQIAARLGMKPLSYRRALYRAGLTLQRAA